MDSLDDTMEEIFGDLCNIYERAVWGPYEPDDGVSHTSDLARAFAVAIFGVFARCSEIENGGDTDRGLDELICGTRVAFDQAVEGARGLNCHGFQPDLDPAAFEPCATYGGDSIRANEVARKVAELIGHRPVE